MGEVKTITRVPVRALALMGAVIEAVLGLISGIITAISIDVALSTLHSDFPITASLGTGATAEASVIIIGIVGGFISGYIIIAIVALIYNWLAPRIGGIKLELE